MAHQGISTAFAPEVHLALEDVFISRRDRVYGASVNADGWPDRQHRGGPRGFLKFLGAHTLGFADLAGHRQLLTTGNVAANDRVALLLMDYARRERLKIIGRAEVISAQAPPALAAELAPEGGPVRLVERMFRIRGTGFDWNGPRTSRRASPPRKSNAPPLRCAAGSPNAKPN
jgi:predicted pyridoxine 5'-phosphate oxidase superfamily flavin-nucleotide-binding protein